MAGKFLSVAELQKLQAVTELQSCNEFTARYGLILTDEQITAMVEKRFEALKDTGRIEFGRGILKQLVFEFCDSPYLWQETFDESILELLDIFYYFKSDSMDLLTDEELMKFMRVMFDRYEGDLTYLSGTALEELSRYVKSGGRAEEMF